MAPRVTERQGRKKSNETTYLKYAQSRIHSYNNPDDFALYILKASTEVYSTEIKEFFNTAFSRSN